MAKIVAVADGARHGAGQAFLNVQNVDMLNVVNVDEINGALLRGEADRPGLFPHLEALADSSFIIRRQHRVFTTDRSVAGSRNHPRPPGQGPS